MYVWHCTKPVTKWLKNSPNGNSLHAFPYFPLRFLMLHHCFPNFIRYFPFFNLVFISISYFRSYEKSLAKVLEIIFWASSWKKFSATILLLTSKPSVLHLRTTCQKLLKKSIKHFHETHSSQFRKFSSIKRPRVGAVLFTFVWRYSIKTVQ